MEEIIKYLLLILTGIVSISLLVLFVIVTSIKIKYLKTNKCKHSETEKRFVGYLFTEEMFAMFCKECNKQITEPKTQ